jgi:hypothetical protein
MDQLLHTKHPASLKTQIMRDPAYAQPVVPPAKTSRSVVAEARELRLLVSEEASSEVEE